MYTKIATISPINLKTIQSRPCKPCHKTRKGHNKNDRYPIYRHSSSKIPFGEKVMSRHNACWKITCTSSNCWETKTNWPITSARTLCNQWHRIITKKISDPFPQLNDARALTRFCGSIKTTTQLGRLICRPSCTMAALHKINIPSFEKYRISLQWHQSNETIALEIGVWYFALERARGTSNCGRLIDTRQIKQIICFVDFWRHPQNKRKTDIFIYSFKTVKSSYNI